MLKDANPDFSTPDDVTNQLSSADQSGASASVQNQNSLKLRRRGVLKKDSSYDDTLKPILKNNPPNLGAAGNQAISILPQTKLNDSVSSTSSEDLENLIDANNRAFVDVVIDPLPKGKIYLTLLHLETLQHLLFSFELWR